MPQSNVIFGAIFLAYIIFITMRGELGLYLSLLRGDKSQANNSNSFSLKPLEPLNYSEILNEKTFDTFNRALGK